MSAALRWRRRAQGLVLLVVVAALIATTILIYNKSFPWQSSDKIYLQASRIGNELNVPSDVKYDGVLVGRVSAVSSNGVRATLTLQIDKNQLANIPSNVQAQILPKTLFGEKFVQLVTPSSPEGALQVGDTIHEDMSHTSIELQTVFNNLLPVLKALNPAQLSMTLSAVADTLRGRANQLGQNIVLTQRYFKTFNTDLPNLNHDISALATLADNYSEATPNLLATLRNLSKTARTFVKKQSSYANFLVDSQGLAATASAVISNNTQRLIKLNQVSVPVTALYARNSIVLECMPNGLAIYDRDRLEGVFGPSSNTSGTPNSSTDTGGVPALHIALIPVGDRGLYTQKPAASELTELPDYSKLPDKTPAERAYRDRMLCRGLPFGNHPLTPHFDKYPSYRAAPSGNYSKGGITVKSGGGLPLSVPASDGTSSAKSSSPKSSAGGSVPGTQGDGSPTEKNQIGSLLSSLTGGTATPNHLGLEDLLLGPMVRGMVVTPQ